MLRDPLVEDVPRRQPEARGEEEDDPAGEEEEAGDEPGQARDQSAAQGGSRAHARTLDESEPQAAGLRAVLDRALVDGSEQDERPEDPDASGEDAHEPILQRPRSRSIAPAYGIGKAALRTWLGETSLVAAVGTCASHPSQVRCGRAVTPRGAGATAAGEEPAEEHQHEAGDREHDRAAQAVRARIQPDERHQRDGACLRWRSAPR